jgi:hypothetical protein
MRRLFNREVLLFAVVPLLANFNFGFASFFYNAVYFSSNPSNRYVLIALVLGNFTVTLVAFLVHELNPRQALFSLVVHGVLLIVILAGFSRG